MWVNQTLSQFRGFLFVCFNLQSALYLDKKVNLRPYTIAKGKLKFYSVGKDGFSSYGKYADGIYISAKCNLTECFGKRVNSPMRY